MKDRSFSSGILVVEDLEAAGFLSRPDSQRYFTAFLAREATAGQVARELGVDIGSVTYRIRRLLDLGLVAQTRSTARAGRAVRHYRTVADAVFVPVSLTPAVSLRELFSGGRSDTAATLEEALEAAWSQFGALERWGTHMYRTPGGAINRDFMPAELLPPGDVLQRVLADRSPAVWDQYAELHLDRDLAKELQRELAEVVGRYSGARPDSGPTQAYLVRLALAAVR